MKHNILIKRIQRSRLRRPRAVRPLCVAALCVLVAAFFVACECDPDQGNFAFIGFSDIPAETYTFDTPLSIASVNFSGRVYYPSYDESILEADLENPETFRDIVVADGRHPIVIFGHGRYTSGVPTNYLGMTNLMKHLASWGYICLSINLDVLNTNFSAYDYAIPHRGELFLHGIEKMLQLDAASSSIFYGKIDATKIGLIGHSRGGGAAIWAVNTNAAASTPRAIKALATISPVDFGTLPLQTNVPHISLYGTWDGDLSGGDGPLIWDDGVRTAHKELVTIYGANHFHFTDAINYSNETEEITREDHWAFSQGFITAYFHRHIKGSSPWDWDQFLTGYQHMRPPIVNPIQYLEIGTRVIDDGSPLGTGTETANNLGGMNTPNSLSPFDDKMLTSISEHYYNKSEGLEIGWNAASDDLEFAFPAQDVNAFTHLHFRACAPPHMNNTVDASKNFHVRLQDAGGGSATVALKDYLGGIPYPDASGSGISSFYDYKAIMKSFRIPLQDFAGVNMTQVVQVKFLFDIPDEPGFDNASGMIAIDDLEFTN